jgi:hypothetical protein
VKNAQKGMQNPEKTKRLISINSRRTHSGERKVGEQADKKKCCEIGNEDNNELDTPTGNGKCRQVGVQNQLVRAMRISGHHHSRGRDFFNGLRRWYL